MAEKEEVEVEETGKEYSPANIAKLTLFILCVWAFFSGVYAALIFVTTGVRDGTWRHLPPKYIGDFAYGTSAEVVTPTFLPKLAPWVKALMCPSETTTCIPTGTAAASNPMGFVASACTTLCTNA